MQDPTLCPAHSSTVWSITHHSDQQWRRLSNKCRGEEVEQEILECWTWTLFSYTEPPNISYLIFGSSVSLIIYNQYQLKKRDWLHCCHDILTSIQYREKYQFWSLMRNNRTTFGTESFSLPATLLTTLMKTSATNDCSFCLWICRLTSRLINELFVVVKCQNMLKHVDQCFILNTKTFSLLWQRKETCSHWRRLIYNPLYK